MTDQDKWWETHDNLVTLVQWMADEHYDVQVVANAVEKPWHYGDEFAQALAALVREQVSDG